MGVFESVWGVVEDLGYLGLIFNY